MTKTNFFTLRSLRVSALLSLIFILPLKASNETPACQFSKKYFSKRLKMKIDCNAKFLHYCHEKSPGKNCQFQLFSKKRPKPHNLKIAGFNVLNLGMEGDLFGGRPTTFKSHKILAKVINRWDIVAAIELKHFAKEDFRFNKIIVKKHKKKMGQLIVPPYLQVLKELQKDDESWSLILSKNLATKSSDDTLNNELTGFYYRSRVVDLAKTQYCNAAACTARDREFPIKLNRNPFLATFSRGKKKFTYIANHIRFGRPTIKGSPDEKTYARHLKFFNASKVAGRKLPKPIVSRFAEVKAITRFIAKLKRKSVEKDFFYYADFNIPAPQIKDSNLTPKQIALQKAWYAKGGALSPLPKSLVIVNDKTTLSDEQLVSQYDHFIFNSEGDLRKCQIGKASSFNFTSAKNAKPIYRYVEKFSLSGLEKRLRSEIKFDKNEKIVPRHTERQIDYFTNKFRERIIGGVQQRNLTVFKELISDHLPIQITCPF